MAFSWKQPRPQAGTSSNSGATSAGRVTRCKCCGGTDFVDFSESGDRGCAQCGTVLQENNIVSTVQFSESGGSSNVVGQFVSGDKGRPSGGGGGAGGRGRGRFGHSRDSRETTIQNGKKRIGQVLSQLHLRANLSEPACRLFSLCVNQNYVQGRKTMHIVAACVYIVCRQQHFPIMLIDISDKLAVNVYKLGNTFKKLIQYLNLQTEVPIVDPAMYIKRFADKLDLGNKQQAVCITALKIIGAMKRDFLASGRQPSGVCCAALTLATRVNRIERSKEEIRRAVKVCDATVQRRLLEFEQTPTSQLTVEQLNSLPVDVPFPGVKDTTRARVLGGGGEAGGNDDDDEPVLTGAVQMDPPAYILNRIRDGQLKMPARYSSNSSKMPWLEQTLPRSKRPRSSNGATSDERKGNGKQKKGKGKRKSTPSSSNTAAQSQEHDDDDDDENHGDGGDDETPEGSDVGRAKGKGKGKAKGERTRVAVAAGPPKSSGANGDASTVGGSGQIASGMKAGRKRQRPAAVETGGQKPDRPMRAAGRDGLSDRDKATADGKAADAASSDEFEMDSSENGDADSGSEHDDDADEEEEGEEEGCVDGEGEDEHEEDEEDDLVLKLGLNANTKEGREALTRHVLLVRGSRRGRRMSKSRAKRNKCVYKSAKQAKKGASLGSAGPEPLRASDYDGYDWIAVIGVDEQVYSALGRMFDEDEEHLDLTRPSWVTEQTGTPQSTNPSDQSLRPKRDNDAPADGGEGGNSKEGEGEGDRTTPRAEPAKELSATGENPAANGTTARANGKGMVDNNSVSLSGVQGASKASSSLSRGETETTGTGNNCHSDQGETAATAVVIEDEDWGLYIRAEEDYQRTKQVWTKEHKEWIEDQEEKSRLLEAEGTPPTLYKKRKKNGSISKNGGETFAEVLQVEAKKNKSLKIDHAALQRAMNTDGSLKCMDDDEAEMEEIFEDNLAPSMPPSKRNKADYSSIGWAGDIKPRVAPQSDAASSVQHPRPFAGTSVLPPAGGRRGRNNNSSGFGGSGSRSTEGRGSSGGSVSAGGSKFSRGSAGGRGGDEAPAGTSEKAGWVPATPKDGGEAAALEAIAALIGTASTPSAPPDDVDAGAEASDGGASVEGEGENMGEGDGDHGVGKVRVGAIGSGGGEGVVGKQEVEDEDDDDEYEDDDDYGGGMYAADVDDDDDDPYGEEA